MCTTKVKIKVSDATGQQHRNVSVPREAQVADLIERLLPTLQLPRNDAALRPLSYHARLERTGRELSATDTVSDVIEEDDHIRLMPEITPGHSY